LQARAAAAAQVEGLDADELDVEQRAEVGPARLEAGAGGLDVAAVEVDVAAGVELPVVLRLKTLGGPAGAGVFDPGRGLVGEVAGEPVEVGGPVRRLASR
jgi:hypothetical protein